MAYIILLFMIGIPVAEIAVFIEVGGRIGLWPTVATVILTAVIGTALLRHQGLATLLKVQESLQQNRLPLAEVFDGLCLLVAGALLLTPGLITDAVGFLLFFPPFRAFLRLILTRYWVTSGRVAFHTTTPPHPTDGPHGPTIDGEYQEIDPGTDPGAHSGTDSKNDPPPSLPRR